MLRGRTSGRLHRHRRVVEEVDQGGAEVRDGQRRRERQGERLHQHPAARQPGQLDPNAAYVHICTNETIGGVEYHWTPDTGDVPLVADMSSNILSRPVDVSQVRPDLRRRAEEHRPGRADHRHRARRPDRPGAADHAVGLRLQAAGRQRLDAQHAADLRDLHRRAGVQVDQGAGRPGGDGRAQPRQGGAAVRLPRPQQLLQQPGGARRPLADERAVQAARTRRSTTPSSRARRRAAWCS